MITSRRIFNNAYFCSLRHICDGVYTQYVTEILHNIWRIFITSMHKKRYQEQIYNICRSFQQYYQNFLRESLPNHTGFKTYKPLFPDYIFVLSPTETWKRSNVNRNFIREVHCNHLILNKYEVNVILMLVFIISYQRTLQTLTTTTSKIERCSILILAKQMTKTATKKH